MTQPVEVAENIFVIETGLYRHGLASCYLAREADRLAFVDTGTAHTVPALLQFIADLGLTPDHVDWVIPTHVHLDHAGGSGDLMAACPRARLVVHPKGAPHLIDPSRLAASAIAVYGAEGFARDYKHLLPVPADRMILAEDGMEIDLAGREIGDSIHISAVKLPEGVTPVIADRDFTIATIAGAGGAEAEPEAAAATAEAPAAGAKGAAAPAKGGAAPAAGAKGAAAPAAGAKGAAAPAKGGAAPAAKPAGEKKK